MIERFFTALQMSQLLLSEHLIYSLLSGCNRFFIFLKITSNAFGGGNVIPVNQKFYLNYLKCILISYCKFSDTASSRKEDRNHLASYQDISAHGMGSLYIWEKHC